MTQIIKTQDTDTGKTQYNESGTLGQGKEMKFSWNEGMLSTSASYVVLSRFGFDGSDNIGTPTGVKFIGHIGGSTVDGQIRIYDVTNGQVICESAAFTDISPALLDCGGVSNISTSPAIWELQAKRTGAGSDFCEVDALSVKF